ncbi:MAG: hypothetical protein R3E96_09675 [Planctomycetota bacterium]
MGSRVDTQGLLHLPYLDPIPVSGKDTHRGELQNGVRRLVRDGEVTVDLLENRSNRFYVLGHVQSPLQTARPPDDRPRGRHRRRILPARGRSQPRLRCARTAPNWRPTASAWPGSAPLPWCTSIPAT